MHIVIKMCNFFEHPSKINHRDCLIAKLALQFAKRINEVLNTVDKIDWGRREIVFTQLKTKGVHKETAITYPNMIMESLREYIGSRHGLVFVMRTVKEVPLCQLAKTFARAGKLALIPFKISPHVLRVSVVTFLK